MIYVVSTGWNAPTKGKCIASVAMQENVEFQHIYIEAESQNPPKLMIENMWETIQDLPPESIVVSLDGDDWLANPNALAKVQHMHDSGAWLSYGNFIFSDGRSSFVRAPYPPGTDYRKAPWLATHLKTYRAGLFQRIKKEDLMFEGKWLTEGTDVAAMLPMLEMAGEDRIMYCPEILVVYNYANSFEFNAPLDGLAREKTLVAHIRKLPKYERIQTL